MKGADECPRCGAEELMRLVIRDSLAVAYCSECETTWEPFDPAELCNPEDRYAVFKTPCDNCAFRKGSPERQDPDKWELLQQQIHLGGAVFYCHKGVPILYDHPEESHDHPKKMDGTVDTSCMRMCAGYLAQRLRDIFTKETT